MSDDPVRYDPVTDTLRVELRPWPGGSAADPTAGGEDAAEDLVVHYAPDGRPWALEIEHASRHTELVGRRCGPCGRCGACSMRRDGASLRA